MEKASILAKIVSAYAEDQTDARTMERLCEAVDRVFIQDLEVLADFCNCTDQGSDFIEKHYDSLQNLAISGLVALNLQDGSHWAYQGDRFNPNRAGFDLVTILQGGLPPRRELRGLGKVRR